LWFSINSPGQAVPYNLWAGRAAKVLARAISISQFIKKMENMTYDVQTIQTDSFQTTSFEVTFI